MKKVDLINILVEEYGYEKEDLKFDAEGKPYTNAKLQMLIRAEEEDAKVFAESSVVNVTASKIKDDDRIPVISGSTGWVNYSSKISRKVWEFRNFGQEATMEFEELKAMLNSSPSMLRDGYIIVADKDAQKELGLVEISKYALTPDNIEKAFDMDYDQLEELIDNMPEASKLAFINTAQRMFEDESIERMSIIRLIEDKFKFSLENNAPLSDIAVASDKKRDDDVIYVDKK